MAAEVIRGSEAIKQFFEELFAPFEQVIAEPQKFFEAVIGSR